MRPSTFRPIAAVVCSAALIWQLGCASLDAPPPSAEVRERLGNIAVLAAPFTGRIELETPVRPSAAGAADGAATGFLLWLGAGLHGFTDAERYDPGSVSGEALIVWAALLPLAAIVGAVVGAETAPPAGEVFPAEAALTAAQVELAPERDLPGLVVAAGRAETDYALTAVAPSDPASGYRHLAAEGFASVLEITILSLGLVETDRLGPALAVELTVQARLLGTEDDAELYARAWRYAGEERNYFDWAADDAGRFRAEVALAYRRVAADMVRDLFIAAAPATREEEPREEEPGPPAGPGRDRGALALGKGFGSAGSRTRRHFAIRAKRR